MQKEKTRRRRPHRLIFVKISRNALLRRLRLSFDRLRQTVRA